MTKKSVARVTKKSVAKNTKKSGAKGKRRIVEGLDVLTKSGAVELKNYDFKGPISSSPKIAADTAKKIARQVERRIEEGFKRVTVIFSSYSGKMPKSLQSALNKEFDDLAKKLAKKYGINRSNLNFATYPETIL